jgi:hypothetical protein
MSTISASTTTTTAYKVTADTTGTLVLQTGATPTTAVTIDTSQNVLVGGATIPNTAKVASFFDGSAKVGFVSNETANTANATFFIASNNGSTIGAITRVGSTSAVVYATTSDYRLKENVQPLSGALAAVQQLKPCTYTWKSGGESAQGFIAHELQEVVPDCVVGEKDAVDADGNPKYQQIDTSFLVATLTAAIQEQQVIIEQLRADVETLKGQA